MSEARDFKSVQKQVFELTLALYRVTDFFPQGEVLKKHLREKANEIFGSVTEYGFSESGEKEAAAIIAKTEALKGFLGVAKSMRFVRPINLMVLEREYSALERFFEAEVEQTNRVVDTEEKEKEELRTWDEFSTENNKKSGNPEPEKVQEERQEAADAINDLTPISLDISERQRKIVDHLQDVSQAKISDFYSFFGEISSKTIQRDLQDLVSKHVLKKEGDKRWTIYSLNGVR